MPLTPEQRREGFRLADRCVEPARNRISGPSGDSHIEPRAMAVLLCLAEHSGEVVSRTELNDTVWENTVVTDQALTNCISELRHHLGDDRAEPRFIETVPKRGYRLIAPISDIPPEKGHPESAGTGHAPVQGRWLIAFITGVALACVLGLVAWWTLYSPSTARANSVAVVAFHNVAEVESLDYLSLALSDEITTVLARAKGLAVRPFEARQGGADGQSGDSHQAVNMVTGHFYPEGDEHLTVAIEAREVAGDRLVWRGTISVPMEDVLDLRNNIARRVREGLVPALGAVSGDSPSTPSDADAYRLYLRSIAIPRDPAPNRRAIQMLEDAIDLDPDYAPAWESLARRYHDNHSYGGGSETYLDRAAEAARRALELDPELIAAAQRLIVLETEAGRLESAYARARELLGTHGNSAAAHFSLSYVLRFGGMLEASQRHCEQALELDPHYQGWRSCAFAYMAAGKLERAIHFIDLDLGSYWGNLVSVHYWLRREDPERAVQAAQRLPPDSTERRFHMACLENRPNPPSDEVTAPFIEQWHSLRDPEPSYWIGAEMVYCHRPEDALSLLQSAIEDGYCAYPAIDLDPAWKSLKDEPAFRSLREEAIACRDRFRAAVRTH